MSKGWKETEEQLNWLAFKSQFMTFQDNLKYHAQRLKEIKAEHKKTLTREENQALEALAGALAVAYRFSQDCVIKR